MVPAVLKYMGDAQSHIKTQRIYNVWLLVKKGLQKMKNEKDTQVP